MRSLFRLILSLWFVSADGTLLCSSWREFSVDNCTACPALERTATRGNVTTAVCKERAADRAGGIAYTCVCGNFPSYGLISDLRFFPQKEGNVTRCASSWATVPGVVLGCSVLTTVVLLYVSAHLLYIVSISGICCCDRHACTKGNGTALSLIVSTLLFSVVPVWDIVSQGRLPVNQGLSATMLVASCFRFMAQALFFPSIADVAYSEEDKANQRFCINVSFWCLAVAAMVPTLVLIHGDADWVGKIAEQCIYVFVFVQLVYCNIFTAIAHRKILKVSVHHHHHHHRYHWVARAFASIWP